MTASRLSRLQASISLIDFICRFCFIEFETEDAKKAAFKLKDDVELQGRQLVLDTLSGKSNRGRGGGGGGGFGRGGRGGGKIPSDHC